MVQCNVEDLTAPDVRSVLVNALNNLGSYYYEKGMLHEAIGTLEECLASICTFLPPEHPDIGATLWNLGMAYEEEKNVVKATKLFRECLSVREKSLHATHPLVIAVLKGLSRILFNQELYAESLQLYRRLHNILKALCPLSEDMATVCTYMGVCCLKLGHLDAAEAASTESVKIFEALYPQGHERIAMSERLLHQVWQLKFGN